MTELPLPIISQGKSEILNNLNVYNIINKWDFCFIELHLPTKHVAASNCDYTGLHRTTPLQSEVRKSENLIYHIRIQDFYTVVAK